MDIRAINDLLSIISDAPKHKAVLESIKKEQEKLLAMIDAYGIYVDAAKNHEKSETILAKAEDNLKKSEETAKEIVEKARKEAKDIIANAENQLAFVKEQQGKVDVLYAAIIGRESELARERKEIKKESELIAQERKELETDKQDIKERLAKLKAVMA